MAYQERKVLVHASHVLAKREQAEADARLQERISNVNSSIDTGRKQTINHVKKSAEEKYSEQLRNKDTQKSREKMQDCYIKCTKFLLRHQSQI